MKKTVKRIMQWRDAFEKRLRERLEALSPKARLTIVIVMFSLFAAGCIAMLGSAIYDFGKGKGQMLMEHIEKLELQTGRKHAVPYKELETEHTDCETENISDYETE